MYYTSIDKIADVAADGRMLSKVIRSLGKGINTSAAIAFSDITEVLDSRERIVLLASIPEDDDNVKLFSLLMYVEYQVKRCDYLRNATAQETGSEGDFEEAGSSPSRVNTLRALAFEIAALIEKGANTEEPWKAYLRYRASQNDVVDCSVWHDAYFYSRTIRPQIVTKYFSQLFCKTDGTPIGEM